LTGFSKSLFKTNRVLEQAQVLILFFHLDIVDV
jgi:hypothetical protein